MSRLELSKLNDSTSLFRYKNVINCICWKQVRGLSNQGNSNGSSDNVSSHMNSGNNNPNPPKPSPPKPPTTTSSTASSAGAPDYPGCDDGQSNDDGSESDFLNTSALTSTLPSGLAPVSGPQDPLTNNPLSATNFMNMEHSEALQHLEKALSACEATLTETQGMVKMEPDEHQLLQQQEKPYSISAVPAGNCAPGSPFPAIEGTTLQPLRFSSFLFVSLLLCT